MTFDNLIFAIRDTTEVSDTEIEDFFTELDDDAKLREKRLLETCMELNRPMLHFDIRNRLDLAQQTNEQEADACDDEFYTALI